MPMLLRQAPSRLTALLQHSFSLNIRASKSRVAPLPLPSNPHQQDDKCHVSWMTTYSAFDPGMMRPLLVSSISLDVEHINLEAFSRPRQSAETKDIVMKKPWPYYLPIFLQPQLGTTFEMMYGCCEEARTRKRVGVLQAVLYGLPNPGEGEGEGGNDGVSEVDEGKTGAVVESYEGVMPVAK